MICDLKPNQNQRLRTCARPADCKPAIQPNATLRYGEGKANRWRQLAALVLATGLGAAASSAQNSATFPFVLPWDDASPGITDLSGWLPRPAGKAGHVRVGDDGHFYAGADRLRFLGVNLSFGGNVPTKPEAEKIAARLAKFGVNVVRFHHMDTGRFPDGIRTGDARTSGELHPEALDRLHYFIAQLKQRGIYANLNLLVGRPFNAADGLPAEIEKLNWKDRHIMGFFDAKQLELEKEFARRLLTARNPYTGLASTEDPAVAFVEINNEQGLVHAWLGNHVDKLGEPFVGNLQQQWNRWLRERYGTTQKLSASWNRDAQPLGAELLVNSDFSQQLEGWGFERHGGAEATFTVVKQSPPGRPANSGAIEVKVQKPGAQTWHVQMTQAGLKLEGGKAYTLRFWAKADAPRDLAVGAGQSRDPWGNLGLASHAAATTEWREFTFVFNASQTEEHARISFSNFGPAGASVILAGISLRPGGVNGLRENERIESASVARFERGKFGERTAAAQRDWMRFLTETEDAYWQAMFRFLKQDLKTRALVTGTIAGCSPLNVQAKMEWVDTHAYWQHPHFPGRPWDSENWIVQNKSMVNEVGGRLPGLALRRVAGKPHAVTEYNHAAPNTYSSEAFLLLAAYAALQDWDAIYVYSYAHSRKDGWDGQRINSFFDIDQHPTKMATLIAAAAMFLRGDVQAAQKEVNVALGWDQEIDLLRNARAWDLVHGGTVGVPAAATLKHRTTVTTEKAATPAGALSPEKLASSEGRHRSDTGQLEWNLTTPGRGFVSVNSPQSKALIGFTGGKRFELGEFIVEPGASMQDGWSAITVTAIRDDAKNQRWLITATGYADNTDMKWKNAEKTSVGRDWGKAPSRVEGIPARLILRDPKATLTVWALDERGQRQQQVPVESTADGSVIQIGPKWRTLWYEISAAPAH